VQVLARQTGGQVVDPSNDVAGEIDKCIADIGVYYTLVFAAPPAAGASEYHELKVTVNQPGLVARTSSGYYNQP
jgi:hypothetical protein